jgi:hypothetical protein
MARSSQFIEGASILGPHTFEQLFGPFLALCFAIDFVVLIAAWVQCRFLFSRYVRKHHPATWSQLVHSDSYRGPNVFVFDLTANLYDFRTQSKEDLGDPGLRAMRSRSNYLFRTALILWLLTVAAFLVGVFFIALGKRMS